MRDHKDNVNQRHTGESRYPGKAIVSTTLDSGLRRNDDINARFMAISKDKLSQDMVKFASPEEEWFQPSLMGTPDPLFLYPLNLS
jgi:hypothetical protein